MSQQGGFERRQLLIGHQPPEAFPGLHHAGSGPAQEPSRQRFTLRVTWRMVPFMFSMMLVQARERRNSLGRTHRISSSPFQDGGGDAGPLLVQPPVADQLLGPPPSPRPAAEPLACASLGRRSAMLRAL
jgi:hypothetical protein